MTDINRIVRNIEKNLAGEGQNIEPGILAQILNYAQAYNETIEQVVRRLFGSDKEPQSLFDGYAEFAQGIKEDPRQPGKDVEPTEEVKANAMRNAQRIADILAEAARNGGLPDGEFILQLDPTTGELTQEADELVRAIVNGDFSGIQQAQGPGQNYQFENECMDPDCPCHDEQVAPSQAERQGLAGLFARQGGKSEMFNVAEDQIINQILANYGLKEETTAPLPDWAERQWEGVRLERMTQLSTKDGRRTGNAVIFDIVFDFASSEAQFWIITDAGNILKLNFREVMQMFHEPTLVLNDYPNNEDGQVDDILEDFYFDLRNPNG